MHPGHRKIHLDFHTHPAVTDICACFDPDQFADTLAQAGVDCVVLFAKGHYGYAFFASQTNPIHPHLQRNFLPEAAAACRARGIRTEAYISVCCDYQTFLQHPEWACRNADGSIARWSEVSVLLDLSSPLLNDVVLPFTEEVARTMPVDGLWFDIVMYPTDGVYSDYLTARLRERGGEDTLENRGQLAHVITVEAQARLHALVKSLRPEMDVLVNNQANLGATAVFPYNDIIEVESDPTHWPQYDLPLRCRYLRGTGKPHHGLTTRFHRCWGDFGGLRAPAQLQAELGMIYAAGTPWVSVGDHLHPSGVLEPSVYGLIGEAYAHSRAMAPLVEAAIPQSEIALLAAPNPSPFTSVRALAQHAQLGAARLLVEEHLQFSVHDVTADIPAHEVLLLPGGHPLPAEAIAAVRARVAAGQPLLALGEHVRGLEDLVGCPPAEETALDGQHLCYDSLLADARIGSMPVATYRTAWTFLPSTSTEVIGEVMDPLFDGTCPENYHAYGPVNPMSPRQPAIVRHGNAILCGVPLAELIHTEGAWPHLMALARLLRHIVGMPLVQTDVGPCTEVAVHRLGDDAIIHLVTAQFTRGGAPPARLQAMTPVRGAHLRLHNLARPEHVEMLHGGNVTEWQASDQTLDLTVNLLQPHAVLRCTGVFAPSPPQPSQQEISAVTR
jgi:hypothetical protein